MVGEARLSSSPGNEASNNHCITLENPLTYGRIIYFGVFIVALLLMGLFFVSNTSARNGLLLSVGGYALISLSLFLLFGVTVVGIIRAPRQVQIGDDQIVLFFIRGGRKVVPMGSVADLVVPKEDKDSRWGLCGVLGIKGQRQRYSITHEAARTILARYIAIFSRAPPVPDWYHDAYNPDGTEKSLWKKRAAP